MVAEPSFVLIMGQCLEREQGHQLGGSEGREETQDEREKRAQAAAQRAEAASRRGQQGSVSKLKPTIESNERADTDLPLKWTVK